MHDSETVANLGIPLGADLSAIERELTEFWGTASQRAGETATIRACSCNLMVVVSGQAEAEALPPVLADVAEWHPCRSLVAFQGLQDAEPDSPPMRGWIRVQCRRQSGGWPQVCSEVITIGVRREAAGGLADTLASLLVPDLPVFLYWRSPRIADRDFVEALIRLADLLIVDSEQSPAEIHNGGQQLGILAPAPRRIAIRDLAWSRLTAWRDLIAQFFDTQASRSLLKELTEVEIQCVVSPRGGIPKIALLLAGWLASRLSWRTATAEQRHGEWISRMAGPDGDILIRFTSSPAGSTQGVIGAVTLRTRSGNLFSVSENREQACMTATATGPAAKPVMHTVPCLSTAEADLLVGELSLPGEDTGFQAALAAASALETSLR